MNRTKVDDRASRIIRIVVGSALAIGLLILIALKFTTRGPNRCPIDGHVAQWTKHRDSNSCDYGHFSTGEKTFHTWTAVCQ